MKISVRILFILSLFFFNISIQAQQVKWVHGGGSADDLSSVSSSYWEQVKHMCTDPNGNVYVASQVGSNPLTADTFHTSGYVATYVNILVTSYNCNGQMRWAKFIYSTGGRCQAAGIIADSFGHVYLGGRMQSGGGTLHIGYDATFGVPYENYNLAVIQFDTNGHYNWLTFAGSNTVASFFATSTDASAMSLDGVSNVHLISYLGSGAVFMPGDTSHYGTYDMAFNSSGVMISAKRLQLDSTLGLYRATIDKSSGKLYACGYRSGAFPDSSFYPFMGAFDTARHLIWLDTIGTAPTLDGSDAIEGIQTDGLGNVYWLCDGEDYLSYRGDTTTRPSYSLGCVLKTDTAGNTKWLRTYTGSTVDNGFTDITLMPNGKIGLAGQFAGVVKCQHDSIVSYAGEGWNSYFSVLDTAGDEQYMFQIHGNSFYYDAATRIVSDHVGNLYIGGYVGDTMWAGSVPGYRAIAGGNTDFFVIKYGVNCSCTAMPVAAMSDTGTHIIGATYTGTTTGVDSLVWSFGDGHTAYGATATHTYTAIDTYQLCVTVYTNCGQDSVCTLIPVRCITAPVASFSDTGTHTVGFVYSGTTAGIDSAVWNYGDGSGGTGLSPFHTYTLSGTYHVCVTVYTPCGSDSSCSNVTVHVPTLIQSVNEPAIISVYPNPAKAALTITGIQNSTKYRLLSVTGFCVAQGMLQPGSNTISVNECAAGIYVLEMSSDSGQKDIVRVVKQ